MLGALEPSHSLPRLPAACWDQVWRFGPGSSSNPCDLMHFWSVHGGGGEFLFADGAVRFLAYSASHLVPALATRAGGDAVAEGP